IFLYLLSGLQRGRGYLARTEIERVLARYKADPKRLEPFGFKVYSQGDEDGIIEEIFRRIGVGQARFCEIGVEDGLECNSLYLLHKGWTGFWFENNVGHKEKIHHKFGFIIGRRLEVKFDLVTAENANDVVENATQDGAELDFLSI